VKLNSGLQWQKVHSARRRLFYQQIRLELEEETSKVLHLDWSHLTQKLPSKASYRRKDKGRDGSDKKPRKKTKKLLGYFKDRRGYSHLKEDALDRTMWSNRFGRGFGPVVRRNTE
jgi:hypothetical protein